MSEGLFSHICIAIRGGGDLGSGVAYRLFQAGFPVLITELAHPLLVRRAVSYGSAVIEGSIQVGGIRAMCVNNLEEAQAAQASGTIPVIVDPDGDTLLGYKPMVLIDARLLKQTVEQPFTTPLTVGLGPGFIAGANCDAVIETKRGHNLGRVIYQGSAEPNTGIPGRIAGKEAERVLRAPVTGVLRSLEPIGALLDTGQPVAEVNAVPVIAPFAGVLRGLVHDGLEVKAGAKIGDVDARSNRDHCFTISDKSLAIGGGVLEAVLGSPIIQQMVRASWVGK